MEGGETTTSSEGSLVSRTACRGVEGRRTNFGVEVGVVQVADNLLDGRDGPVPKSKVSVQESQTVKPEGDQYVLRCLDAGRVDHDDCEWRGSYILKLPPTKNLRAMMGSVSWEK